jgi:alkaline phosphatase D
MAGLLAKANTFEGKPVQEMVAVGRAAANAVRLWMRAAEPGRYRVRWWPEADETRAQEDIVEVPGGLERDNTHSFSVPVRSDRRLKPLQRYSYDITAERDGRRIGEGTFETAPEDTAAAPERFTFAVMSCNQPFDSRGVVRKEARDMLIATRRCLEAHDVKAVFMMGDQMYADLPKNLSLFNEGHFRQVAPPGRSRIQDCTVTEVRRLYQERHRLFWNVQGLQEIFAMCPCYMILDDHDIVDNWGSAPEHQTPEWQSVGEGARWAYYDYQASRERAPQAELPASFHYEVRYGCTATFVMDLRSERRAGEEGQLFSDAQEQDLRAFLDRHAERKVLFFVLSVPPVHLPRFLTKTVARLTSTAEDFSDRWSAPAHVHDRDRFLKIIRDHGKQHPEQRIVLLGGDIHVGCVQDIQWHGGGHLYQLISSGLTNEASFPLRLGARGLIRLKRRLTTVDSDLRADVRLLDSAGARGDNPYGKRNMGLVEVDASGEGAAQLRFRLYGHDGPDPVCVYASSWV